MVKEEQRRVSHDLEALDEIGKRGAVDRHEACIGLEPRPRLLENRLDGIAVAGPGGMEQGQHTGMSLCRTCLSKRRWSSMGAGRPSNNTPRQATQGGAWRSSSRGMWLS